MRRQLPPPHLRSAYTLLEVLLALAVISVLAGVTIPSALRMYADSKLTDAAEKVRAMVGETRLHAINMGERFQFRYEKHGRHYVQIPVEVPIPVDTSNTTVVAPPRPPSRLGILPEGLHFTTENERLIQPGSEPISQPLNPDLFNDLPKSKDLAALDWSPAIIFAEDGSANDASWIVVDTRKQAVPVEVRGLTGAATIAPMFPFKDR
ncbi:MAG: prepilin-type N-terminal cleavage/methylation domain-containing protein [Planctomycetaceae bacterium]|nr:prepilin-type N-terminal cleavage/methylation domain-containing protein [Planctomycetaceae bacterium]